MENLCKQENTVYALKTSKIVDESAKEEKSTGTSIAKFKT